MMDRRTQTGRARRRTACGALAALVMAMGVGLTAAADDTASLDELLGLPMAEPAPAVEPNEPSEPSDASGAEDAADLPPAQCEAAMPIELDAEVARRLRGEAMAGNPFESALVDMNEAAERLGRDRDAGRTTQRIMQEALDKLDRAIAAAEQQQSSGGGSSQSAGQRGEDAGGQQMAGQSQQTSGRAGDPMSRAGGEHAGDASPGSVGPQAEGADDPLAESRREWGSLPPRVRRELAEGVTERISEPYRGLTERYFEALTQEP
ncbi:MAG: hypothetical protein AAF823_09770 [Planctomycetota bacterium]